MLYLTTGAGQHLQRFSGSASVFHPPANPLLEPGVIVPRGHGP